MKKRFSVLIPVYNVEKYLDECIKSIINQTYKDYEIIMIDDGSTDRSGTICDSYKSEDVKVFHQTNKGLLLTRRIALKYATGEYCLYVDSDDVLDVNALAILNKAILEYKTDLIIFNRVLFVNDDINNKIMINPVFENNKIFQDQNKKDLYWNFLTTGDLNNLVIKCVKTEIIKSDPINYNKYQYITLGEDRLQTFHVLDKANRIVYIDKPLYFYRQNENSMTHNIDPALISSYYKKMDRTLVDFCLYYSKKWGFDYDKDLLPIYKGLFIRKMTLFNSVWDRCDKETKNNWILMNWSDTFSKEMILALKNNKVRLNPFQFCEVYSVINNNYKLRSLIDIPRAFFKVIKKVI